MESKFRHRIIIASAGLVALTAYALLREVPPAAAKSASILPLATTPLEEFRPHSVEPVASPVEPVVEQRKPLSSQPLFDPQQVQGVHMWVDAELLIWQSNMGGLAYGTSSLSSLQIEEGRVKYPHFDWDVGCRVGLGYKLPHDKWDVYLAYTHLNGNARGHTESSNRVVFPSWASQSSGAASPFYADTASAHWHLNLNRGDLDLGRNCFVSEWLSLRPFVGVSGLWVDQTYKVNYGGGTVAPSDTALVHLKSDCWGVGVRMGVNSLWGLGKGFSIYGDGSASLLAGHFKVHETEKLQASNLQKFNIESDPSSIVGDANLALGLQWDCLFSRDRYHLGVKFGWEFDLFFNQNQLFNFLGGNPAVLSTQSDDLSFQGVTVGFRFDF
jgi:hypothetical protein